MVGGEKGSEMLAEKEMRLGCVRRALPRRTGNPGSCISYPTITVATADSSLPPLPNNLSLSAAAFSGLTPHACLLSSPHNYSSRGPPSPAPLSSNTSSGAPSSVFDADAVCRSVVARCSHVVSWEKKHKEDGTSFAAGEEEAGLLDLVKLSIGLSPQTMRRFWRVSALRPEDVLQILAGLGSQVGRKEVDFLLKLFAWAGKQQPGNFRHLPTSYDTMISMLIRARMFAEAESLLLQQSPCGHDGGLSVNARGSFFSQIIQGYVEARDWKASIASYDRARCRPDVVVLTVSCYRALLRWSVELGKADSARRVYKDMVDAGLVSSDESFALHLVVRTLCSNGKVSEAVGLLRRVRDLGGIDSLSCAPLDSIADGYCKKRDFGDLLSFLREWRHVPGIHMCNRILSCACRTLGTDQAWLFMENMQVLGFEADAMTFQVFIRWSCREGKLMDAFVYLSELFSRMLRPDVRVYNALLSGVFKEGMWEHAKQVYADMVEKGIMPDLTTFQVVLAGHCRERKFDEVTLILGEMANHGFVSLSPSNDALSKAFSLLGLHHLCVKVKRDNNMLFPKAEFFDSLGNGLYLDTDIQMYEQILTRILDDAMFPDFDHLVEVECRKCEMETALIMKNEAVQHGQSLSFSTYSELLKGLITSGSSIFIREAVNVLEEVPELCNHLDHHTLNLLLRAFSNNGISVKAKLILDVLLQRGLLIDEDTCSAAIMAFCKGGDLNGFQEFWEGLQRNSCIPEIKDIGFLLNSLLKLGMFNEVFELFESMSLKYAQSIPAVCNAFVKEFCTTGHTAVGYVFVDEVLQRGLVLESSTYEYLVTKLLREKKVADALHIFDLMLEKKMTPSSNLCEMVVHVLFRSGKIQKDKPLKQVKRNEESETLFPFREALLTQLHRIGRITKAGCRLQMPQVGGLLPCQSILDVMIQTYCRENNFRKACTLLCLIIKMHLHLGISTYRDLVRLTCSIGRTHVGLNLKDLMLREYEYPPQTIYNIIIFYLLWGRNSSFVDVVLDDMQQQFCSPDQICYNFLIHGYYNCGNAEKSVDLLNTMIAKNLQPNNRSLRTVICYLCNHRRLNEAINLSQAMESKGWKHGSVIQTILVESLLSHGRLHEAEQLLGRLEDKDLIPDKACYDTLIRHFCRIGRVNTAVNLLNIMFKKGELPSENSYNFVLHGFLICNAFDEALDIHAEMLHNKIQLSMESYDMLIHGLCGNGRTGDVERLLEVMLQSGQVPTKSMLRAIFDKYHSENSLCKTSKLLEQMQRHGVSPDFETHWSLISNLNSVKKYRDDDGKGFLTHLLSQTGSPAKGSKTKGANTALTSVLLP